MFRWPTSRLEFACYAVVRLVENENDIVEEEACICPVHVRVRILSEGVSVCFGFGGSAFFLPVEGSRFFVPLGIFCIFTFSPSMNKTHIKENMRRVLVDY